MSLGLFSVGCQKDHLECWIFSEGKLGGKKGVNQVIDEGGTPGVSLGGVVNKLTEI